MPARAGRVGLQLGYLLFGLLHAVLAEVFEPGGDGLADERGRVRLADGDERDLFGRAPRASRRTPDAPQDIFGSRA